MTDIPKEAFNYADKLADEERASYRAALARVLHENNLVSDPNAKWAEKWDKHTQGAASPHCDSRES